MMITTSDSQYLGSLPSISCSRVPVWPWVNTSVSVSSAWVFGSSWCCLQLLFLANHWPCNCPHFCRSLFKSILALPENAAMCFTLNVWKLLTWSSLSLKCVFEPCPWVKPWEHHLVPETPQALRWAAGGDTTGFGWAHGEWTHWMALLLVSRSLQRDPGSDEE